MLEEIRSVLTRAIEFTIIFLAVPLALFFFFPVMPLYITFFAVLLASLYLLHKTPNFAWRDLWDVPTLGQHWKIIVTFFVCALVGLSLLAWQFVPTRFLDSWQGKEDILVKILFMYPFLSALPQEIVYRVLFFKRYKQLFRNTNMMIIANAACFSLFHLFYQNWFAVGLTLVGGLAFGWVYARTKSFSLVCLLHAIAGQIIFISGLGTYFYHGAINQGSS